MIISHMELNELHPNGIKIIASSRITNFMQTLNQEFRKRSQINYSLMFILLLMGFLREQKEDL